MKLSYEQTRALDLLKRPDPHGDPKTAEVIGGETWADNYTVWVNVQTAKALERRGLIEIDRAGCGDGWEIALVDGSAAATDGIDK